VSFHTISHARGIVAVPPVGRMFDLTGNTVSFGGQKMLTVQATTMSVQR
jgi:hypothetical protein